MVSKRPGAALTTGPSCARSWEGSVRGSRVLAIVSISWARSVPELLGGDPGALGHRRHLGPDHVGIDRGLADPGAVATVAAGDDVLAANELGVAADALRDQLRMLDEIRFRFDHAGDQHLAG